MIRGESLQYIHSLQKYDDIYECKTNLCSQYSHLIKCYYQQFVLKSKICSIGTFHFASCKQQSVEQYI